MIKFVAILALALLVAHVSAQSFPILEPAAAGSLRSKLDITPQLFLCSVRTSTILLGYSPTTGAPIYRRSCTGACLSPISAPTECAPTYAYIVVSTSSNPQVPGLLSTVQQVSSCNCRPRRCRLTVDGQDIFYAHGSTVIDNCNRRCTCRYGVLTNCCRQRKEFRLGLTTVEKERYLNAVKTVSTNALYKPQYDALIQKHSAFFGSGIHGGSLFFPWHREYIWDLENLLQQVDCRVTVPYWRWSLQAANPFGSNIWSNTPSGFGGNGVPGGSCIGGGSPFAPPWQTSQAAPQCLRRNFINGATFATEADITQALDVTCPLATQFTCMRGQVESFHNYVHNAIGGQMASIDSSNDPIFFMHHTYIDRLWARWQAKSAAHVTAYSGATNVVMPASTTTPADWFDLNRQRNNPANRVCYIDPPVIWWLDTLTAIPLQPKVTTSLIAQTCPADELYRPIYEPNYSPVQPPCITPERLRYLPRVPLAPYPAEWLRNMRMTEAEIAVERNFYNDRNNATLYNLLSTEKAIATPGITSESGFYLYDEDYSCISKQVRDVDYTYGDAELPYSPYNPKL